MVLMISWGYAADRLGRKPVLVFSLAGVAVATALFGLSKTIWQMILFRCLAGIFAGSIVTIRAMISENSTQKTQARAFSLFAFTGNLGIFLGPLLGSFEPSETCRVRFSIKSDCSQGVHWQILPDNTHEYLGKSIFSRNSHTLCRPLFVVRSD